MATVLGHRDEVAGFPRIDLLPTAVPLMRSQILNYRTKFVIRTNDPYRKQNLRVKQQTSSLCIQVAKRKQSTTGIGAGLRRI
jgi:hypothetical protein